MDIFIRNDRTYINTGNKEFDIGPKDISDLLNNKQITKKIDELTIRYVTMIGFEIDKMDLSENEKLLIEFIIMDRLNKAAVMALEKTINDI